MQKNILMLCALIGVGMANNFVRAADNNLSIPLDEKAKLQQEQDRLKKEQEQFEQKKKEFTKNVDLFNEKQKALDKDYENITESLATFGARWSFNKTDKSDDIDDSSSSKNKSVDSAEMVKKITLDNKKSIDVLQQSFQKLSQTFDLLHASAQSDTTNSDKIQGALTELCKNDVLLTVKNRELSQKVATLENNAGIAEPKWWQKAAFRMTMCGVMPNFALKYCKSTLRANFWKQSTALLTQFKALSFVKPVVGSALMPMLVPVITAAFVAAPVVSDMHKHWNSDKTQWILNYNQQVTEKNEKLKKENDDVKDSSVKLNDAALKASLVPVLKTNELSSFGFTNFKIAISLFEKYFKKNYFNENILGSVAITTFLKLVVG